MSAREKITTTLYRCARYFDEDDIDGFADCFSPDAQLVNPDATITSGRAAIRTAMRERQLTRFGLGQHPRHLITNVEIEIGPSEGVAISRSYFALLVVEAGGIGFASKGAYFDEWVQAPDGWRMTRRRVDADPVRS
jgi:3-phenylpropionate/cinnamic acid dioxygenase small subunit